MSTFFALIIDFNTIPFKQHRVYYCTKFVQSPYFDNKKNEYVAYLPYSHVKKITILAMVFLFCYIYKRCTQLSTIHALKNTIEGGTYGNSTNFRTVR